MQGGDRKDGATRFRRAMRAAAREAVTDALERGWTSGARVGLLHAVALGEVDSWREFYLEDGGRRAVRHYLTLMPSTPMSMLMQEFGFHGPATNVSAMCASGNAGFVTAQAWLDAGIGTDVLLIATDLSLTPENMTHFRDLGVAVVDQERAQACRPLRCTRGGRRPPERARPRDGAVQPHGDGDARAAVLLGRAGVYSVKPLAGHCQAAAATVEIAAAALANERRIVPAAPIVATAHPQLLDGATARRPGPTVIVLDR